MTRLHREHHSVLAARERRLLEFIAARLPLWVTSDALTLLALTSMCVAAAGFAVIAANRWSAAVVVGALAVNWFGDSLDGTIARVRHCERPRYGYYVDHVVDLAGVAALVAGMGSSGVMHPLIAAAVLVGYVLVAAESFLGAYATGTFRISFAGVGPTELRILLAVAALRVARNPIADVPALGPMPLLDIGGAIGAIGLALAFVISAIRNTRELYKAEPRPRATARHAA
jgi:archaetidylinositol phosphate synthase